MIVSIAARHIMIDDVNAIEDFYHQLPRLDARIQASAVYPGYGEEVSATLTDVHCAIHDLYPELGATAAAILDEIREGDNR